MRGKLFIVMLRRPGRNDPRPDPYWEFGSFGITGCHRKNLLHPEHTQIRDGDRLAFVQGGHLGLRLLLITPPIKRIFHPGGNPMGCVEVRWDPGRRPFRYVCAPSLQGSPTAGSVALSPQLAQCLNHIKRPTLDAKFASRFRVCSSPLGSTIAKELEAGFNEAVKRAKKSDFIVRYEQALPWCDAPGSASERKRDYQRRLRELMNSNSAAPLKRKSCK